jgi:hypothetical protein
MALVQFPWYHFEKSASSGAFGGTNNMFKVQTKYAIRKTENKLNFVHTILYQNASWRGYDCLMFHIC